MITGIDVARWSTLSAVLSSDGDRCKMMTNDIPLAAGMFSKNLSNACNPPADAPIPTTGKLSLLGTTASFVGGVAGWSSV